VRVKVGLARFRTDVQIRLTPPHLVSVECVLELEIHVPDSVD
jgi:hypothetical protein